MSCQKPKVYWKCDHLFPPNHFFLEKRELNTRWNQIIAKKSVFPEETQLFATNIGISEVLLITIGFTTKFYIQTPRETSIFHEIGNPKILYGTLWVGTSPIARFGAHHRLRHRILHRHCTPQYFRSVPVACGDFARFGSPNYGNPTLLNKRCYV